MGREGSAPSEVKPKGPARATQPSFCGSRLLDIPSHTPWWGRGMGQLPSIACDTWLDLEALVWPFGFVSWLYPLGLLPELPLPTCAFPGRKGKSLTDRQGLLGHGPGSIRCRANLEKGWGRPYPGMEWWRLTLLV